jgi:hypothetical protein
MLCATSGLCSFIGDYGKGCLCRPCINTFVIAPPFLSPQDGWQLPAVRTPVMLDLKHFKKKKEQVLSKLILGLEKYRMRAIPA